MPSGPSEAELERQRIQEEEERAQRAMHDANDRGVSAFNRGDWAAAIEYFKQALQESPGDPDIEHNLQRAREELEKQQTRLARSGGPQPAAPLIAADVRLEELTTIARSIANVVMEYQNNPASEVIGHRQDIQAALEILAARWIIYDREAVRAYQRAVVVNHAKKKLEDLLEEVLHAVMRAILFDVRRVKPFDWDTPARAAQKRAVVQQTELELSRLRQSALSELGDLQTSFHPDAIHIEFHSGPALRQLHDLYQGGRWRNL